MIRNAYCVGGLFALVLAVTLPISAAEIGYIEDFALAEDRQKALEQLIPGTEQYYFYHCLHYQNTEQFDKVEETLAAWIKRHGHTARVRQIQNRQALLTYTEHPRQSLDFLKRRLGIHFEHQRQKLDDKPSLPTALDQNLINRQRLLERAFNRYQNLDGLENRALDWVIAKELDPKRRRNLLQRLRRPDYPNLPRLVVDDLNYKYSRGFGSLEIHKRLLLPQLDKLLELKPELLNQTAFVNVYLTKLRPNPDVDWRHEADARRAYLDRLWEFVRTLAPVHNSLKAHVLYHRLVFDRRQGVYDKPRFMEYLKLPRNASYMDSEYLNREENRRHRADLSADFSQVTLFPAVRNDEPLVRSYLAHFFVEETTYQPYETYVNDVYLKHLFAETKIVHGLGEGEKWYSMLPPEKYQRLKERIDLDFAYTNETVFAPDEPVSLELHVKNVEDLIVKVYELNTLNFYRENLREIDTDINLDGLVPNVERTHRYDEPPLRRVRRRFEFPSLQDRGVYVIDFIGNGKSSRALVRKGRLHYLVRTTAAGQAFTILDEQNNVVEDAALWLDGHRYTARKEPGRAAKEPGRVAPDRPSVEITVPFTTSPGRQPIILSAGDFSSLAHFRHEAENYQLQAAIYIDREQLLKRKTAQVVVRPSLRLNGTPVSLSLLDDVTLEIISTDHDGIASTQEIEGFKLFEDRESVHEFQVPARLASIQFRLKAKVKNLSQNKDNELQARHQVALNQINKTEKVEDLHFLKAGDAYSVELLGRTGEPKPDRPVRFAIKHRDFKHPVELPLQTDDFGRIALGALEGIDWVKATGPEGTSHTWHLLDDRHTYHREIHGLAGETIELPYMGEAEEPLRSEMSLLELRDGTFVADRFEALEIDDALLRIKDLPAGDYDLLYKESGRRIHLRLTEGKKTDAYALGDHRNLELRGRNPLQLDHVEADEKTLTIRLRNATKFARVHLLAVRYRPAYPVYGEFATIRDPEPYRVPVSTPESLYVEGRNIGDEYRYIIERKQAETFPGNMLQRPEILLNPWAIRQTETTHQVPAEGEAFGGAGAESPAEAQRRPAPGEPSPPGLADFANLDFLAEGSLVLANLVPDENGRITIPRDKLGPHQQLHVVAVDPVQTAYRTVALTEAERKFLDLRLVEGLDPEQHFTQQKRISIVPAGGTFTLDDISTSRFEAYDSLRKVYRLFATLSSDDPAGRTPRALLAEFRFILDWPELKPEEKREKYSQYACHELNFFLFKKDPEFFRNVVRPYLAHKKDKTFLDRWFLEQNLPEYRQPWEYDRLNVVEQVLLARRVEGELVYTSRHVNELYELLPPNIAQFNRLFDTGVKGTALDVEDAFGFRGEKEEANMAQSLRLYNSAAQQGHAAPPGPPGAGRVADGEAGGRKRPAGEFRKPKVGTELLLSEELQRRGRMRNGRAKADKQADEKAGENDDYYADRAEQRQQMRQLYKKLEKTKEWVENNYYKLPIEKQNGQLITVNAFWQDFAGHDPDSPFLSTNLAEASRNFPEMMYALSLLDLPFEAKEHKTEFDGTKMTLEAAGPMIVFHEEVLPAKQASRRRKPAGVNENPEADASGSPILVSQNFFRHGDRYRYVRGEKVEKYVTDEFLIHTVYGCQVVVTNPTSTSRKLDLLLQVPEGAVPVLNTQYTKNAHIELGPYQAQAVEYYFYFPAAGDYQHYPVHVARDGRLLAHADPVSLHVVEKPSQLDRESWEFVSQFGTDEEVLAFLREHNLQRIDLSRIAFRMKDEDFFRKAVDLLSLRHAYDHTLWSYSIKHDRPGSIREYLQHADSFVRQCGLYLDSPLLVIDPVKRYWYQHREYRPLVNARTHKLGRRREILNDRLWQQYHLLLRVLGYRRTLDDEDLMAVTYYMLLQDRVAEGLEFFGRVNPENLATRLQYDYFASYADFYRGDTVAARDIATRYADYPVERWRDAFRNVIAQIDEIEGAEVRLVDTQQRTQVQTQLAGTEPSFDFTIEARKVTVNYQNLAEVQVNYYLMDVELLFSRNPFVQQYSGQFTYIKPNASQTIELPEGQSRFTFGLPEQLHNANVLVEIVGGGQVRSQAYYSHSLNVQVIENYGQLRVLHSEENKPLPETYVKVYARMKNGHVRFYKDGYTDLRGRFDFTSLNTDELEQVEKFSLLVFSDRHGAVVREAAPPKR